MLFWANLIGYQITWFTTVIGAARGYSWPGVMAASIFIAANLAKSRQRSLDLKLISLALALGVLTEGSLAMLHLIQYGAPNPAVPPPIGAPLWIVALWMAFSVTLNRSLARLLARPLLAAAFGAVGGPLAYSAAADGWGTLKFEAPQWRGELWLGVSWAISMYLFAQVIRVSQGES